MPDHEDRRQEEDRRKVSWWRGNMPRRTRLLAVPIACIIAVGGYLAIVGTAQDTGDQVNTPDGVGTVVGKALLVEIDGVVHVYDEDKVTLVTTVTPTPTATATASPTATPTATVTPPPTPTATPPAASVANAWVNTSAGSSPSRCATACAYDSSRAYGSFAAAANAVQDDEVVRVRAGTYGPQGSFGNSGKSVLIIGADGTTVDTGSGSGTYNHFNLSGNVTVENVDVAGDYPLVQIYGNNNTWRKSTLKSGRLPRRCNSDEPILLQDGEANSYTINNNLLQDLVIEQQRGSLAGQGGCPSNDPFHLEMVRVGRGVSDLKIDRVTFGPCPSGSGFIGCASGQLFVTTNTTNGFPPRNLTVSNSRFHGAVNFHIQTHQNLGTSNLNWTFAYNTFGAHEPIAMNGAHTGFRWIGNIGPRPQTCYSGNAYIYNTWQWDQGTPCGSDKRVNGPRYSTSALGLNSNLTLAAGSPGINAAEPGGEGAYCEEPLENVDYDGDPRPNGAGCDAGSDER